VSTPSLHEEVTARPYDARLARRLWGYVLPYRRQLLLAVLMMVVVSATGLVGPYLIRIAIDHHIAGHNAAGLTQLALVYVLSQLINWVASYYQTYHMTWIGQRSIYQIRQEVFGHLQLLGFKFFDSRPAGVIMSRVTNDVNAMSELISSGIVHVLNDTITLTGIVIIMLKMHTRLALVSFVTIPLLVWAATSFRGKVRRAYDLVRQRIAMLYANLQESISGVRVTQAFVREQENLGRFNRLNQQNFDANLEAIKLFAIFGPFVQLVGTAGTCLVLYYGGRLILGGSAGITIGILVAFSTYLNRFFVPIQDLTNVYNMMQAAMAACEKVFGIMDTRPDITDAPGARTLPRVRGRVEFCDVTFGYDPARPVLHQVNLVAEPGQRIALVGETGAGKSSIINLLARFYEPTQGRITIDGHDLSRVTTQSLRRQLGIVLQDTFLFSGSVRENIRYGRPEASDAEVVRAAKTVGAHVFITALPDGYDTDVGERGGRLSVGQRQLVAFARALLCDPAILILDEATSSVDAYTELLIQRALDRLLEGRTSFIIAHRLSTIRSADLILVLDQGRIVERGRHQELLAQGQVYARLYELQFRFQDAAS
jgi:ATP-binding cassette subfamily B protein